MEERTALVQISVRVYTDGDVDLLDLGLEDDEDPQELEEKLEEKLAEMSHYVVNDLDGFFGVYTGFDADDEEDIRESARDRDLLVFADGSVYWGDGENLIDSDGQVMDQDSFSSEAELSGAEVIDCTINRHIGGNWVSRCEKSPNSSQTLYQELYSTPMMVLSVRRTPIHIT